MKSGARMRGGALAPYRGGNGAMVPFSGGSGNRSRRREPKGQIQSNVLPHAGMLGNVIHDYFGIDLARLPLMSDQELAQFADMANQMKRLTDVLPILEKHFTTLIEGQVTYEQFIARVLKLGEAGAKKIDKAILDAWLLSKGYDKHLRLLSQQAALGVRKMEVDFQTKLDLANLDFNTAVQLIGMRHRVAAMGIRDRIPQAQARMQIEERLRQESEYRKELITYGTGGYGGQGVGFLGRLTNFFRGR